MTFVLAGAIVVVFIVGLIKSWWTGRMMKKQEKLDAEKRARSEELRKSGISTKRGHDVPFGVRALQSGIEVEGIWICDPKSESSSNLLAGMESDSQRNGGQRYSDYDDGKMPSAKAAHSPNGSISQRPADAASIHSGRSIPLHTFSPRRPASRPSSSRSAVAPDVNEDTLRRLEGRSTPVASSLRNLSHGSTGSVSGDTVAQSDSQTNGSNLLDVPRRSPQGSVRSLQQKQSQSDLPAPNPTFGPGELHYNRGSGSNCHA